MPRPPSPLWEHFSKVMPNKRATCNYCGFNMCGLVIRMRMHLARKCESCPDAVKIAMIADLRPKHEFNSDVHPPPAKKLRDKKEPGNVQPSVPAPASDQNEAAVLTPDQTTAHEETATVAVLDNKSDLDGYVARAIFGGGLPVTTVEHSGFVKMLKRMDPSYDPPSAFALATSILDLEYSEVLLKLRAEVVDSTAVSLGLESSTALQNHLLVSCVINKPSPVVFGFESSGDIPHTPEELVDKIEDIMTQIGTGRVSVIVTDTSENMKQASTTLQNKYPAVTFLPSCEHIMNAMVMEMLDTPLVARVLDICKQLARFFAHDHDARTAIARILANSAEVTTPMGDPDDLSPSGLLECLHVIERNRDSLEVLLAENGTLGNLNPQLRERLKILSFWEDVSTFTELFGPFLEILKMFESDSPLLSTFYHRFSLLWAHLDKFGSLASKFQHTITGYWQSIQHPAMYTAYLLDPRFPPSSLSGEATSEALVYIKRTSSADVYGTIVDELTRFTARTGLFADDAIWESAQKCSPIHWWKGFIGSSCPNLQPIALRTLVFPATAGLSRSKRKKFEKVQAMHAKYMNEEQASKAAVVYLNSNFASSVEDGVANETRV